MPIKLPVGFEGQAGEQSELPSLTGSNRGRNLLILLTLKAVWICPVMQSGRPESLDNSVEGDPQVQTYEIAIIEEVKEQEGDQPMGTFNSVAPDSFFKKNLSLVGVAGPYDIPGLAGGIEAAAGAISDLSDEY